MPGYADTGALSGLGQVSGQEMQSFNQATPSEGINPYTYENLMRLPVADQVIQYMADSTGLAVEDIVGQMQSGKIPPEGMKMLFDEAFNIMSAPKGGSAMDRYNQRR
jgi:hypothetical protein